MSFAASPSAPAASMHPDVLDLRATLLGGGRVGKSIESASATATALLAQSIEGPVYFVEYREAA